MIIVSYAYIFIFTIFILAVFFLTINFYLFELVSDSGTIAQLLLRSRTIQSKMLIRKREIEFKDSQSCKPASYGIPSEKDSIYFSSPSIFPNCELNNPDFLFLSNSSIFTTCPTEPLFIYGPGADQEHFGNYPVTYLWKPQSEFKLNKNTEWVISKCGKSKNVLLRNVFNATVAKRAKNITNNLINHYKTKEFRPLTVLLIVIDSVSRQSFYRNLEGLVAYLNENLVKPNSQFEKNFVVYDFLINNVQGEKTPQNMAPILYGLDLEVIQSYLNDYSIYDTNDWAYFEKFQEKNAIWKVFEKFGFVTLFSYDSYTDYIPLFTGRKIKTDHVICNFWKAGQMHADFQDFTEEFQCVGNRPPYNLTLNYLLDFTQNYKGMNRFAYTHFGIAHESTGTRLKFIEEDLISFFSDTFQEYSNESEDFVLMLASDHGRMNTVLEKDTWQEKLLPMQMVFMNRKLVERLNAHENLIENVDKLVTRFDWHKTLKDLAEVPYRNPNPEVNKDSFSLLFQKVHNNRTCLDAKVPGEFCSCTSRLYQIPDPYSNSIFTEIVEKSIEAINSFLIMNGMNEHCKNIVLGQIESVSVEYLRKKDQFSPKTYFIEFSDLYSPDFKIKITAINAKKNSFSYISNRFGLRPILEETIYTQRGVPQKLVTQVIFIENIRKDYTCAGLMRKFQPAQGLCKCIPKLKYKLSVSQESQISCNTFCNKKNEFCADYNHIARNQETLLQIIEKNRIKFDKMSVGDYFGIENNTLIIPTKNYCETIHQVSLLFCICTNLD